MLCVGEMLNFMKFVALRQGEWQAVEAEGRAGLGRGGRGASNKNPSNKPGAGMLGGGFLREMGRRWRIGAARLPGV